METPTITDIVHDERTQWLLAALNAQALGFEDALSIHVHGARECLNNLIRAHALLEGEGGADV